MAIRMSSRDVPVSDRQTAMLAAICDSVVKVEISHEKDRPAEDIDYRLQVSNIGKIVMFSAKSTPITINRTLRHASEETQPEIVVGLQVAGSSAMVQNGRYAAIQRGEFAIWDTASPYTLFFDQGANQQFFRFPRSSLALPPSSLSRLTAVTFGREDKLARFVSSHFSRMADTGNLQSADAGQVLARPTIDLLRGLLATRLEDSKNSRSALDATLELRIIDYMTSHLAEPDLTAQRIALAHHISIRYLYVVLGRADISPGEWIRTRRLEACLRELADPSGERRTISEVAHRWGFSDRARFSQMFRNAFGLSPQEWRAESRRP